MPPATLERTLRQVWDRRILERWARGLSATAIAELTQSGRGPARAADFAARTARLLREPAGAGWDPVRGLRQLAAASLHISHPCAVAQQIAAPIPLAALAEGVTATLNQSIAVWDMSPAGTLVDREVMRRFIERLGYPATAEGTLVPGGSYANLTALLAARARLAPRAWRRGGGGIAILAGAQTHYSIARAAGILGLGTDCVFPIALDGAHRANPAAIPAAAGAARRAGYRKFILVATSGSTPTGSFDDLEAFAAAARRLGAWLHVDAAHGGGFAFHRRRKRKLRGIERADSIAFDPHKMMFMPLTAGAVLVRRGRDLRGAFEQQAPYLFSPVRREVADVGPFTLACSQRFDALKIWLVWQAYGPQVWADLIEATCAATEAAWAACRDSRVLEPAHRPESNIFCFRLRGLGPGAAADRLHWQIKEAVNASGKAYISSTVLDGRRVLRLVMMNPRTGEREVGRVLAAVERAAASASGRHGAARPGPAATKGGQR